MKTVVIKLSGKSIQQFSNVEFQKSILNHFSKMNKSVVIVHGAGKQINQWADALGHKSQFINGQRVTDEKMMDIVLGVQGGIINKKLCSSLNSNGYNSVGLSGIDFNLFSAKSFDDSLGLVGKPKANNSSNFILDLLKKGIIPVFSSICMNEEGNIVNVNADLFTSELASLLNAEEVYFFSDIEGVRINGITVESLIEEEIIDGIAQNQITDGMIPKLNSCLELVKTGISKVWIGNNLKTNNNYLLEGGTFVVQNRKKLAV